jgi:hypothetical protein
MIGLMSGCIFSPKKGGEKIPPPVYGLPASPEIVMQNLAKAYQAKDSVAYKNCFDPRPGAYLGTSLDQTDPSAPLDTVTYLGEAAHIAALAKSTTISTILLDLSPNYVRSRDEGDPAGWALIQNPVFRLEINDGITTYVIQPSSETLEFRFIPTLDSRSPTDTTWQIIRWTEVRQ